jgi:hypothetical protein
VIEIDPFIPRSAHVHGATGRIRGHGSDRQNGMQAG